MDWDESEPQDGGLLSQGAKALRDLKVGVSSVSRSMYWSGASYGEMRLGTFRTSSGLSSALSTGTAFDTSGNASLFLASDVSLVYSVHTSLDSLAILSARAIEYPTSLVTTARWVMSSGTAVTGTAKAYGVTYNGIPTVRVSLATVQKTPYYPLSVIAGTVAANQFTPSSYSIIDVGGFQVETDHEVMWSSLGSVSF